MLLSPDDAAKFYAAWRPLLTWVNQERAVVPNLPPLLPDQPLPPELALPIRNLLWKEDALREAFVAQNPAGLSQELLDLVASWNYRKAGFFSIIKHLKIYSVFLNKEGEAYGVLGLYSAIEEMIRIPPPAHVEAVLLPFGDRIITDGLITAYPLYPGPNIRRSTERTWRDISERRAVQTSLLPMGEDEEQAKRLVTREKTNRDVLRAFHQHLLQKGLSEKITARDLGTVEVLATMMLDRPVRACQRSDLEAFLRQHPSAESRLGLKRFFEFLRETERMGWAEAEALRVLLKG